MREGAATWVMARHSPNVNEEEEEAAQIAWRKWERAAESLNHADEAEDFQAIGMRCREVLLAMVKQLASRFDLSTTAAPPLDGDFLAWSTVIARKVARGRLRSYLVTTAKATWQYVQSLTHDSSATPTDAETAVSATGHVLEAYSRAVTRH